MKNFALIFILLASNIVNAAILKIRDQDNMKTRKTFDIFHTRQERSPTWATAQDRSSVSQVNNFHQGSKFSHIFGSVTFAVNRIFSFG